MKFLNLSSFKIVNLINPLISLISEIIFFFESLKKINKLDDDFYDVLRVMMISAAFLN